MFLKYSLADASGCLPIPSFYALLALCFYYYVFVYAIFLNVPIKIIIIILSCYEAFSNKYFICKCKKRRCQLGSDNFYSTMRRAALNKTIRFTSSMY